MKKAIWSAMVLFTAMGARAQTPSQSSTVTPEQCGPAGCIAPSSASAPAAPGASPAVIRASSYDPQAKTSSEGRDTSTPARAPLLEVPAGPLSDFEQFVADALGHPLPVFGRDLFRNPSSSFAPSLSIPVPSDYMIGPGDEILVRAWGKIDVDAHLTVDRNGQVFIPRVGTLNVAGLRFEQLPDFIHAAIAQQFKDFQLTVTLGQLRSIQIFVLGEAQHPGVYTISSLSTLVNALFASGGPSITGSLRDIQVKRNEQVITHFDVYRLLLAGDKSADVHLLPGDVIYIPPTGPQIAVDGNVSTPGIFELKPDSSVATAIAAAGGLTAVAGTARVVLEHIVDHSRRSIEEFPLDAGGTAVALKNGDILRVFPISSKIENAVTLRGNVAIPGRYAWHAGMRVSDMIPSRESLLTRAFYNGQNLPDPRSNDHPFGTANRDITPDVANHETEIDWNYAVIERLSDKDLTTRLIPFALGEAISHPSSTENKELEPGDVVVIYSRKDLGLPQELQAKFVRIDGQVKAPGVYRVEDGETLRDILRRAGGLTPHSYLYASELTRESVRAEQQVRLHELLERVSEEALSPANLVRNGPSDKGTDAAAELEIRKAYLARLNDIHPTGRVVLRLRPNGSTVQDVPDFLLEDGDHFFVPSLPNTVDVLGNVYNMGAQRYLPGQRMRVYLSAAGGATRDGDKDREFIIRADGTVVSRQRVSGLERFPIYPGDAVIVPPRLKASSNVGDLINWTQIVSTFALSALAIRALQP